MKPNQRTILIIDDCLEDRETYRRYLLQDSSYTYRILEEEYGENGLELCRRVKPDAILLDFRLPDIDGLEFLSELKIQTGENKLPVVMLTGQGNEAIAVAAMKNGAQDYLVKGGMTPENLRVAIQNTVELAHLRKQLAESEQRFRTSVENLLDCFGIYKSIRDKSGRIVDFLVEYVNGAACASNRMTKEEQIGSSLLELLPAHRETGLFDDYCQVVEIGRPFSKEVFYTDIYNKQSLTRAFDIRAAKLGDGLVATWRDITDRKRTEERLRLLESVAVNANDAVIITATTLIDEPGPRILYVNEAFTRMTGYAREEVLGRSPRFLQGPKTDRAVLNRIRAALEARQPVEVELINYRKDGSEFWVEVSITPVADATGEYTHFVAIQRDITERKRTQEALRHSEQKYRLLAEATPHVVWITQPDGRLDYCNQQWYDYTGLTQAQTLGSEWVSFVYPDDRERILDQWKKALEVGESYEIEYRLKRAVDGAYRWHLGHVSPINNEQGQIVRWMGTAIDIHDRKQAEEQLRQSQRFIQRIADTTPTILYLYDEIEQRNVYVNRQITEVLGYTRSAIREMGTAVLQNLVHPDDFARRPEYIKQLSSAQDGEIFEFEYRMKDINNEWHWFCSRDTLFTRTTDGSPHLLVGTAQEITQRKRIEAERAQLLAREQAARTTAEVANRAKDEFLAMVSHELRNPLSAILAYAQLLQTRNLQEPTLTRALTSIERNAKLQAKLITDLLDLSRITSGTLRLYMIPVDLAVAIESAIDTIRPTAQAKAIQIESLLEPIFGYVLADMDRLQQIIGNLLSNAIKFTPEGGYIQVKLECLGDRIQVKVSDTGQGISAEFLPYVFDRFRQATGTGSQGGLGLGLAIARHLVELHGGTIEAESPGEGQGATFTIKLPLIEDDF
jgi:PAS domain S-box-containing protein